MNTGYYLVILLGVAWTAVAVSISEGKRRNSSIPLFYLTGSALALVILAILSGGSVFGELADPRKILPVCWFAAGAVLNGAGQAVSMSNLKQGGRALAYAIPQQAFLFPYVWSIFFWGQRISVISSGGIVVIALAVLFLSLLRNGGGGSTLPKKRLFVALLAMLLQGVSQILLVMPTQVEEARLLTPLAGACVIFASNIVFFLVWCLLAKVRGREVIYSSCIYGVFWGISAAASYCLLLPALRMLRASGQSGIVFPAGIGILILLYTAFTAVFYHERLNWKQKIAFGAIVLGIFMAKAG